MTQENTEPQTKEAQFTNDIRRVTTNTPAQRPCFFPNTTNVHPKILNVLIQMKKDNKSDHTINFTRKVLTFLSQHTSLLEHARARAPTHKTQNNN
jgi:hypothetical protein